MVSGNDCKYCNVLNHRKQFFKGFKISLAYYFRAALKGLALNSSVLRSEDEEY